MVIKNIENQKCHYNQKVFLENINEINPKQNENLFNFDIVANTFICKKYYTLLNQSISSLNFNSLYKNMKEDFLEYETLAHIANEIRLLTYKVFKKNYYSNQIFEGVLKIKNLIQLFLNQIRYDANIWLRLNKKQRKQIKTKEQLNWNLVFMLMDFRVFNNLPYALTEYQRDILKQILSIRISDSFEMIKSKLFKIRNSFLALRIFMLEREGLNGNDKKLNKEFENLIFATVMQMIAIFVRQNIRLNTLH
ncbi:hypothetical protein SCHIN_v1c04860 [Spiroplasma chinense]|uniref:Uncharacterized protein n=1 Tax=Spiroplasma chinense TaxID=216932 RepID=A0A5B9Y4I8_9MOLU|nr:hypothetical protein [Spiroplasma chinense]QEH61683.1 hypothetical protein SCHIN_v1c04860 [Spiroplasma chinense]